MRNEKFNIEINIPTEKAHIYGDKDFESKKKAIDENITETQQPLGFFAIFGIINGLIQDFIHHMKGKDFGKAFSPGMEQQMRRVEKIEQPPEIAKDVNDVK